jgi:hypothetical protein
VVSLFLWKAVVGEDCLEHLKLLRCMKIGSVVLPGEEKPPEEAFNPDVKRSGWEPPKVLATASLTPMLNSGRLLWKAFPEDYCTF